MKETQNELKEIKQRKKMADEIIKPNREGKAKFSIVDMHPSPPPDAKTSAQADLTASQGSLNCSWSIWEAQLLPHTVLLKS